MDGEFTLGELFEDIAERLASARTKALMGEREEALGLFQGASLDYTRFREVLQGVPGHHALEHAFAVTMHALCSEEQARLRDAEVERTAREHNGSRTRKRIRRAA